MWSPAGSTGCLCGGRGLPARGRGEMSTVLPRAATQPMRCGAVRPLDHSGCPYLSTASANSCCCSTIASPQACRSPNARRGPGDHSQPRDRQSSPEQLPRHDESGSARSASSSQNTRTHATARAPSRVASAAAERRAAAVGRRPGVRIGSSYIPGGCAASRRSISALYHSIWITRSSSTGEYGPGPGRGVPYLGLSASDQSVVLGPPTWARSALGCTPITAPAC